MEPLAQSHILVYISLHLNLALDLGPVFCHFYHPGASGSLEGGKNRSQSPQSPKQSSRSPASLSRVLFLSGDWGCCQLEEGAEKEGFRSQQPEMMWRRKTPRDPPNRLAPLCQRRARVALLLLVLLLLLPPVLCSVGPRVPLIGALRASAHVLPGECVGEKVERGRRECQDGRLPLQAPGVWGRRRVWAPQELCASLSDAIPGTPKPLRGGRGPKPALSPLLQGQAQAGARGKLGQRERVRGQSLSQGPRRAKLDCHLRTELVRVHELGLGHDSDELIRFQYCSGACPKVRSNHDITLAHLLRTGRLRLPTQPGRGSVRVLSHPCCRPTAYKAVSFMDVSNTWRTVDSLSAAACGCLG
uniref:Artemin n=1 Tax=Sarcophilus harrisii TaxID=9305 RepID=A0A7N4PHW3_SARHA